MAQTVIAINRDNYSKIQELISEFGKAKFVFRGEEMERPLFISTQGNVCYKPKGYRNRGLVLPWGTELEFPDKEAVKKSEFDIARANAKKVVKYLETSGFWSSLKNACQLVANASDEEIKRLLSDRDNCPEDIQHWYYTLQNLYEDRCVRTVNFGKFGDYRRNEVADAVANHKDLDLRWRVSYDNSLEIKGDRAWYSEEYKGCGNGHYYFLLDEKHVLYGEDD